MRIGPSARHVVRERRIFKRVLPAHLCERKLCAPPPQSGASRGILAELDQELAEIAALQQADEGLRRPVEPFDDVLAVFELAAAHQERRHGAIFAETLPLVTDNEPLDLEALAHR